MWCGRITELGPVAIGSNRARLKPGAKQTERVNPEKLDLERFFYRLIFRPGSAFGRKCFDFRFA